MVDAKGSGVDRKRYQRTQRRLLKWAGITVACVVLFLIILTITRIPAVQEEKKSAATVAFIESQHITMADVNGTHLPPTPDPAEADATVAGVDANKNGIRDDVELAIFKKYPNDAQIRAAELQYAMDLQLQITYVTDTATWQAAVQQRDRGFGCLYDTVGASNYSNAQKEVEILVLDTSSRISQGTEIEKYRVSYKLPLGADCDVITS